MYANSSTTTNRPTDAHVALICTHVNHSYYSPMSQVNKEIKPQNTFMAVSRKNILFTQQKKEDKNLAQNFRPSEAPMCSVNRFRRKHKYRGGQN